MPRVRSSRRASAGVSVFVGRGRGRSEEQIVFAPSGRELYGLLYKPQAPCLGGTLALRASANDPHGIGVALWEPVLDTAAYVQELLRVNISTQMMMFKKVVRNRAQLADAIAAGEKVSVNGFDLCRPFVEEL